ncbi:hydrogen gas-evolving membrane-bound hydrogenase subunit E [Pontibacter sp. MBLB2868]|uniref:hydrogen gas-evolving membrane-bound hydrogenase subunit E n=1 Tax=Pontibacter sp. MBLB2868 TaxID=3451555 RepID=UPI003F756897
MLTVIIISLIVALSAPLYCKIAGKYAVIPVSALPICIFAYLCTLLPEIYRTGYVQQVTSWVPALGIEFQFRIDGLSLLFALLISFFGFLIIIYSSGYLKHHVLLGRFYMYLTLFMTAMVGLVTADNIFLTFVFWELTSISSYLLIGFDNDSEQARVAAWQALLVTGFGGLALLAGLVLLSISSDSFTFSGILVNKEVFVASPLFVPSMLLILLACFTKSAQFPFHFWLPNAMQAPTPVSAYLHSATMVKAGIYLLARLSPVYAGSDIWQHTLIIAGGLTALLGAALALQHTDLKAMLAYTTLAALGLMVTMIGIDTPVSIKAMLVFLVAHALYKGTMFLVAGAVDHSTGTREFYKLNGLARNMPVTALSAALAALSMAGLMPFFGFIGKELMYEATLESSFYVWVVFGLTFLTGISFVTIAILFSYGIFWNKTSNPTPVEHSPPPALYTPLLILGIAGLAFGLMPSAVITPVLENAAQSILHGIDAKLELVLWHGFTKELMLSILTLLLGLLLFRYHREIHIRSNKISSVYKYGPNHLYHYLFHNFLKGAKAFVSVIQNGYLRSYIIFIILFFSTTLLLVLWNNTHHVKLGAHVEHFASIEIYELVIFFLVLAALVYLLNTRSRLTSIIVVGLVGYSAALYYILFGAPDVAATQFLIETLTVVIFVLLLHKLPAFKYLSHEYQKYKFIAISVFFGSMMAYVLLLVQEHAVDSQLKEFYGKHSLALAHGRNIVNVILVDFRGLDTLGEITVLAVAALGIFALLRLKTNKED